MTTSRRDFLKHVPVGLAALPLLPGATQSLINRLQRLAADVDATAGDARWRRVREEFQLNPGVIHLNCGTLGATPRLVIDAIGDYVREIEGNPAIKTFRWGGAQMEEVRARAAAFIGAELDEVAFTRNTTEGMNAIADGIDFEPGDQLLTTNHEHGGGMVCWQHQRRYRGIEIVYIEMPRVIESKQQIVDLVAAHITPRTKACSFSHIDTITGLQMPIAEIAALTRPRDILLVCDGAQAPGMLPLDMKTVGADAYAFSGHKWLLSSKGSGLLYVRKGAQDRVHPTLLHSGYGSYSASSGTRNMAQILAQRVTMDFHDAIGRDNIEARGRQLNAYMRAQLDELPQLQSMTPTDRDLSGFIVTMSLDSGSNGEIVGRMNEEYDIVLKAAQGTYAYSEEPGITGTNYNAIRFSTHIFNHEDEIDRTVEVLRRVMN